MWAIPWQNLFISNIFFFWNNMYILSAKCGLYNYYLYSHTIKSLYVDIIK